MSEHLFKIEFFVPESHLEAVKCAMFEQGAGKVGQYDQCAWQTLGQGQFRPLEGSDAFLGKVGQQEKVAEYKVEMVCAGKYLKPVVDALKTAHPYEEVAYSVLAMHCEPYS